MKTRNRALIRGTIVSYPDFFSASMADEYYKLNVEVKIAGRTDIIPVVLPAKNIDCHADYREMRISVDGEVQTVRQKGHLILYVFAKKGEIYSPYEDEEDINLIQFEGLLKKKIIRKTGKKMTIPIADFMILNYHYYYPCITWKENVDLISQSEIGTKVIAEGKFQSREYIKTIEDERIPMRAYEISVKDLKFA